MPQLNNVPNYVKFMRGTKAAYEALKAANRVSNDILYFIYESEGSSKGELYLGSKLIGGGGADLSIPSKLDDLNDVALNSLEERQVLVFNGTQWVNTSLEDALLLDIDSITITASGELTLVGFENASAGQIATKGSDGNLTWVAPGDLEALQNISNSITNLENNKANKADVYTKEEVNAQIAASNHLQYKIVDSVSDIEPTVTGADLFIYLVPTGDTTEGNLYYEYMVIEKKVEQVGKWSVDLSNYVTSDTLNTKLADYVLTTTFETAVGNLNNEITGIKANVQQNASDITALYAFDAKVGDLNNLIINDASYTTLVEQVNDLTLRLSWEEIPTIV